MDDSTKLDLIMDALHICLYPEPNHICHQCSMSPPNGWCFGEEWHQRESPTKPCGPVCFLKELDG
jgi:hypothetical protein